VCNPNSEPTRETAISLTLAPPLSNDSRSDSAVPLGLSAFFE
jgi:hypothetical protein